MPYGWSLVTIESSDTTSFLAKFSGNFGADNLVGVGDRIGNFDCYNQNNWRRQQSGSVFTTSTSPMCSDSTSTSTTKTYLEIKSKGTGSTTSYYIDMGSDVSSNPQAKTWKVLIRRPIQVMDY